MLPKKLKYERQKAGKESKAFGFFLFFSLLLTSFVGLTVAYFALHREIPALYKSVLSRSWSKTEGKIIKTFSSTKSIRTGSAKYSRSGTVYVPNVNYSFQVEGETFTGAGMNFVAEEKYFTLEAESKEYLDSLYQVNKNVEVFYNSSNPRESTLSREYVYNSGNYQTGCCCGSLGIIFGILIWFSIKDLIKILRKQKNDGKQ